MRSDWQLPCEFRTQPRNHSPELSLLPRRAVAQSACTLGVVERNAAAHLTTVAQARFAHPPLTPPFQGGESLRR
jgi:hypothetical protein